MQSVFNNIINDSFPGLPVLSQVLTPRTKAAEVILTINLLNLDQTSAQVNNNFHTNIPNSGMTLDGNNFIKQYKGNISI